MQTWSAWAEAWGKSWGSSWGQVTNVPEEKKLSGSDASRSSGPDAQVSMADYLRRFGARKKAPAIIDQDEEALALILCTLAAEEQ